MTLNAIIVYESTFGNTTRLARAMAEVIRPHGNLRLVAAHEINYLEAVGLNLLVIGSPVHQHRVPGVLRSLIEETPAGALQGVHVASFDTRYHRPAWITGTVAPWLTRKLRYLGGRPLVSGESFFVLHRMGPLEEGECERAQIWSQAWLDKILKTK